MYTHTHIQCTYKYNMTHMYDIAYLWHDSLLLLRYSGSRITHSYVWHDLSIYVTWPITGAQSHRHPQQDKCICQVYIYTHSMHMCVWHVSWLIYTCDMTHCRCSSTARAATWQMPGEQTYAVCHVSSAPSSLIPAASPLHWDATKESCHTCRDVHTYPTCPGRLALFLWSQPLALFIWTRRRSHVTHIAHPPIIRKTPRRTALFLWVAGSEEGKRACVTARRGINGVLIYRCWNVPGAHEMLMCLEAYKYWYRPWDVGRCRYMLTHVDTCWYMLIDVDRCW